MYRALFFVLAMGCSSSGGFYDACERSADCGDGTACWTVAFEEGRSGQMCTDACTSDRDCPQGGGCWELVGDPIEGQRVCFERCNVDFDCPTRFLCADALMGDTLVDRICLPE